MLKDEEARKMSRPILFRKEIPIKDRIELLAFKILPFWTIWGRNPNKYHLLVVQIELCPYSWRVFYHKGSNRSYLFIGPLFVDWKRRQDG